MLAGIANQTVVSTLSAIPHANFPRVDADNGAIQATVAHLAASMCWTALTPVAVDPLETEAGDVGRFADELGPLIA